MYKQKHYKVTCAVCHKTVSKNNKQETCSIACRDHLKRQRRFAQSPVAPCPNCGETKRLIYKMHDMRACSKTCTQNLYNLRQDPRQTLGVRHVIRAHATARTCAWCGTPFLPIRYSARFCHPNCKERWYYHHHGKKEKIAERLARTRLELEMAVHHCPLCGTSHTDILPPNAFGYRSKGGLAKFHRDHIEPRSNGGKSTSANLRYLCWFCNERRGKLSPTYDEAIGAAGRAFWQTIKRLRQETPHG